jgi:hypothetical protein
MGCALAGTLVSCDASGRWPQTTCSASGSATMNPAGSALIVEMRELDSRPPDMSIVTTY